MGGRPRNKTFNCVKDFNQFKAQEDCYGEEPVTLKKNVSQKNKKDNQLGPPGKSDNAKITKKEIIKFEKASHREKKNIMKNQMVDINAITSPNINVMKMKKTKDTPEFIPINDMGNKKLIFI